MEPNLLIKPGELSGETNHVPVNPEAEMLQARLAELMKETNQFTYIITHDLQAPLRMITGFLELLEKRYADRLDDTARQYIEFAMNGSRKLKGLIFDLLEYSRLNSVTYEFEEVDLNGILGVVKEELSAETGATGAVITSCQLPVVRASQKLIKLLFRHLLENAIKFRRNLPPEVMISADRKNDAWEIEFRDNGMGIEPAFLDKIFIIFRKLHSDEARYPGSGTGLAVCKKIAELHGGTIGVTSTPGEGTTFKITLPI